MKTLSDIVWFQKERRTVDTKNFPAGILPRNSWPSWGGPSLWGFAVCKFNKRLTSAYNIMEVYARSTFYTKHVVYFTNLSMFSVCRICQGIQENTTPVLIPKSLGHSVCVYLCLEPQRDTAKTLETIESFPSTAPQGPEAVRASRAAHGSS